MSETVHVAFTGNPNCGKTTLFNAYTGANLKVANWPGVTVEKVEGSFHFQDHELKLVDLPGTYSLTSYTMEERVAREYILSDEVDVIVDVADASALERNLYLTLQLIELGKPVVLALNMMDIVEKRGMEIDMHRLPEMLGIPVIPVSARKKKGLDILMHAVVHHHDRKESTPIVHHHEELEKNSTHAHDHHREFAMVYSDDIEDKIDIIKEALKKKYPDMFNHHWHALKILEGDQAITEQYPVELPEELTCDYEQEIIRQKYNFIDEIVREVLFNKAEKEEATDRVDQILTNRWLGFPIFLVIMAAVFFLTFTIGDWLKDYLSVFISWFSESVRGGMEALGIAAPVISLVVDGIISGVGGILTFLPNIFILFLALAFLEDSGYMSRAAYVMDSIMGKVGLSGRAFIPMVLGFGCSVPAIMASRALENRRDRLKTMLVTPLMSCSARLPIYLLLSQMFFGKYAMVAAYSMYVLGLLLAILVAFVLHVFDRKKTEYNLLIELPEYKVPSARTVAIYVWEKVKDYLTKAGTTIFIASIIMWFILNFGVHGYTTEISQSFGSMAGRVIAPVFAPLGLGYWQIVVALIAGISAKEVVVSSFSVLFGISNVSAPAGMAALSGVLGEMGFGPLNAFSMMVFCLLYIPCIATIATIKRESGGWKFTVCCIVFQLLLAWTVSCLVFQVGSLLL